MKNKNKALYDYLMDHISDMTDEWLSNRKDNEASVYSANISKELEQRIRTQNSLFSTAISKVLIDDQEEFEKYILDWTLKVSEERARENSPIYASIEQFKVFRHVYFRRMEAFTEETELDITIKDVFAWTKTVNSAFDSVIAVFTKYYYEATLKQLKAQQEVIAELGTPVIPITSEIGVLPLIGDIDTQRAANIMESALKQCGEKNIRKLFIDLSGVPIMDTMVAQQIFQVVSALTLIGVKTTLAGVRPEVAQTAVQLGIDFKEVPVQNNLARALAKIDWLS